MPEVTVKLLAKTVKVTPEQLLEKFSEVGLPQKSPDDTVSAEEKIQLTEYLRKGGSVSQVQLKRKTVSKLKSSNRTTDSGITVEVRKKRTYVRQQPDKEDALDSEGALDSEDAVIKKKSASLKLDELVDSSVATKNKPEAKVSTTDDTEDKVKKKAKTTEQSQTTPVPKAAPKSVPKAALTPPEKPPTNSAPAKKVSTAKDTQSTPRAKPFSNIQQKKKSERKELHVKSEKRGKRKFINKKLSFKKVIQTQKHEFEKPTEPVKREVSVFENVTVKDLARGMAIKSAELVKQMMAMGMNATVNQAFDQDTATLIVEELGHTARVRKEANSEEDFSLGTKAGEDIQPRAPVVTIMGHVDHGKTSLLDYIRNSRVAANEAGSITQHIGAYRVTTDKGAITFLDTPGHAAFTAMRARGAKLTDIVVLVIAADDSVMPQTEEAINHARFAKVPIVVAINKIDKPNADIEKVKGDLAQHEVVSEEWGGNSIFVEVSAKTGQGVDSLLEAILLQAEVMDLKAAVDGMMKGVVIESALDHGRGAVVTTLVQQGTLKKGDILLAGGECGRVRNMLDENGDKMLQAKPSFPALVFGLPNVAEVGEEIFVVEDERKAKKIAELRKRRTRESSSLRQSLSTESFLERLPGGKIEAFKVLIKGDVQGSVEALKISIEELATEEIKVEIVALGIGAITESDVSLALASGAMIIGFNVRADTRARKLLQANNDITFHYYSIIYEAIDDVRKVMSGMLKPEIREQITGVATVKDIFRSSKFGLVAGSQVVEGSIKRGNPIRVLRDNVVIYEGELESLRRFKDEAKEVTNGMECGIAVKDYNDVKVGDNIEVYEKIVIERSL